MNISKYLAIATCAMLVGSVFAGTVTWQCYEDAGLQPGQLAYLFEGDGSGVAGAITGGTFDGSSAIASAVTDQYGEIEEYGIGSYVNTSVTLYMVVFDAATEAAASNFIVSAPKTLTFGTAGNKEFYFTDSFADSTWAPTSAVPEPTSVALLALGLAALGLKRKVA